MTSMCAKELIPFFGIKVWQVFRITVDCGKMVIEGDIPLSRDGSGGWIWNSWGISGVKIGETNVDASLGPWFPATNRFAIGQLFLQDMFGRPPKM